MPTALAITAEMTIVGKMVFGTRPQPRDAMERLPVRHWRRAGFEYNAQEVCRARSRKVAQSRTRPQNAVPFVTGPARDEAEGVGRPPVGEYHCSIFGHRDRLHGCTSWVFGKTDFRSWYLWVTYKMWRSSRVPLALARARTGVVHRGSGPAIARRRLRRVTRRRAGIDRGGQRSVERRRRRLLARRLGVLDHRRRPARSEDLDLDAVAGDPDDEEQD